MDYICKACGHVGDRVSITPSYFLVEIFVWIGGALLAAMTTWLVIVAPIIYSIWRQTSQYKGCGKCKSKDVIPTDSPIGRQLRGQSANGAPVSTQDPPYLG